MGGLPCSPLFLLLSIIPGTSLFHLLDPEHLLCLLTPIAVLLPTLPPHSPTAFKFQIHTSGSHLVIST